MRPQWAVVTIILGLSSATLAQNVTYRYVPGGLQNHRTADSIMMFGQCLLLERKECQGVPSSEKAFTREHTPIAPLQFLTLPPIRTL